MSLLSKINIIIALTFCLCVSTAHAQHRLASDKALAEFYNPHVKQELDKQNSLKGDRKSTATEKDVASAQPTLKKTGLGKIKNPEIVPHEDVELTAKEKKKLLTSNSARLKQVGKPAIKHPAAAFH